MMGFFSVLKIAVITNYLNLLPSLDAVNNTVSIFKKILNAAQVVGFAGATTIAAISFAIMAWAGERLRDKVKSHLGWIFGSVIGLFAVSAIITLAKTYSQSSFG